MKICIVNGPNLNLLGVREPEVYGRRSFEDYLEELKGKFPQVELEYFQSNHEGALIDFLQGQMGKADGIVLNGGAYTHTSLAMADAISATKLRVVEVHISNIYAREEYRRHSYTAAVAAGVITGLGLQGYELAIRFFLA